MPTPPSNPINLSNMAQRTVPDPTYLDLINKVRTQQGLTPLREDAGLNNTARLKAQDMADRNYWAHTTPDGQTFDVLINTHRPGLSWMGENLAECFLSKEATVQGWIQSPTHYENMIRADYNVFGSATVWDADMNCYITANHFGRL